MFHILRMKLSDYLAKNGVSQHEFAAAIGVTPKAVDHWVNGLRTPRKEQMLLIVRNTLGAVTPNDFFAPFAPLTNEATKEAAE